MNIQTLLDQNHKTRYWLVKALDSNYETINRLCDNTSVAIHLDTIEKLCKAFDCAPTDLFVLQDDPEGSYRQES